MSILQSHLRGEDWNAAEGKDGGIQVPYVSPRPRRLRDYTHCLQHPARRPGEGQPPTRIGVRMVPSGGVLGVWEGPPQEGTSGQKSTVSIVLGLMRVRVEG